MELPPGWERLSFAERMATIAVEEQRIAQLKQSVLSREAQRLTADPLQRPQWQKSHRSPLPQGWEERYDPISKRFYYADRINKTTVWDRPTAPPVPKQSDKQPTTQPRQAPALGRGPGAAQRSLQEAPQYMSITALMSGGAAAASASGPSQLPAELRALGEGIDDGSISAVDARARLAPFGAAPPNTALGAAVALVLEKLAKRETLDAYCADLQRLHVACAQPGRNVRALRASFEALAAPDGLDAPTLAYRERVARLLEEGAAIEPEPAVGSVDVYLKPGELEASGGSLPQQVVAPLSPRSADATDFRLGFQPHSFALGVGGISRFCAHCNRLRTSFTAFVCSVCGLAVHKHCMPFVKSPCSTKLATAELLVGAAPRRPAPDLRAVQTEGWLDKRRSSGRGWDARYFVLPADQSQRSLYYFEAPPPRSGGPPPRGCLDLSGATVKVEPPAVIAISSPALPRAFALRAATAESAAEWASALQGRVAHRPAAAVDASAWHAVPPLQRPRDAALTLERQMTAPGSGLVPTACLDADRANVPLTVVVEQATLTTAATPAADASGLPSSLHVTVRALYAAKLVAEQGTAGSTSLAWGEAVQLGPLCRLPPETILLFSLYETTGDRRRGEAVACRGHVHLPLADACGFLQSGSHTLGLWEGEGSAVHLAFDAPSAVRTGTLRVTLPVPPQPVAWGSFPSHLLSGTLLPHRNLAALVDVLHVDPSAPSPLAVVSSDHLRQAWQQRAAAGPELLSWVVMGCDFLDPAQRLEAASFCGSAKWNLPLFTALHLVSLNVSACAMRASAMLRLVSMVANETLQDLAGLLMLAVRLEPHDASPLIETLLRRAVSSDALAFTFFWAAKAQAEPLLPLGPRFASICAVLAHLSPLAKTVVRRDVPVVDRLVALARDPRRSTELPKLLAELTAAPVVLPTAQAHAVTGIDASKTKAFRSGRSPVLLFFTTAPGAPPVGPLFVKAGDDLRQDELVTGIGRLMNRMWSQAGIRVRLATYQVTSVADRAGFIECIMPDCTPLGTVQGTVAGALSRSSITDWLMARAKENKEPGRAWNDLVETFVQTLAGAVVFEYCMGIGDRHCDNILLTSTGSFVHIDFGMIFGKDWGLSAKTAFSLTAQMLDVLGGRDSQLYRDFEDRAINAFLQVRRHHVLLATFGLLAVGGKMSSVQTIDDLHYLNEVLMPSASEDEARASFSGLMRTVSKSVLHSWNDAGHLVYMSIRNKK